MPISRSAAALIGIPILACMVFATNSMGNDHTSSVHLSDAKELKRPSEEFLNNLNSLTTLAGTYQARGYLALARETIQKSIELCNAEVGPNDYISRHQQNGLASFELYCQLDPESQRKYLSACRQGFDGVALFASNDFGQAIPQLESALKALNELNWPPSNDTEWFHENLARALLRKGRATPAMEEIRKAREIGSSIVGANTPVDARCLDLMGDIEATQGKYAGAIRNYAAACQAWRENVAYEPYSFFTVIKGFHILKLLDDPDRAVQALTSIRKSSPLSDLPWSWATGLANAILLSEEGKYAESLEEILKIREKFLTAYGADDERTLELELFRAKVLSKFGEQHDFEELVGDVYARASKKEVSPELSSQVVTLYATILIARNDTDDAARILKIVIEQTESLLGPNHPLLCDLLMSYSKALRQLNKLQEASTVEQREAILRMDINKMRELARTDSNYQFPWER